MKKHYLIYQITNNINGKIYIGKHETFNIDDDYFGSGKLIRAAIKKYGLENFTKTVLVDLKSREEMNLLEKMVVTPEFCSRKDVYNINVGGDGGWNYINSLPLEHRILINKKVAENRNNTYMQSKEFSDAISAGLKKFYREHPEKHGTKGKHWKSAKTSLNMKDPSINVMKRSRWIYNIQTLEYKIWPKDQELPIGWAFGLKPPKPDTRNRNSPAFGYVWINDGYNNKFVKIKVVEEYLKQGWVKGRLIK